ETLPEIIVPGTSDLDDVFSTPWPFDNLGIGGGSSPSHEQLVAYWAAREQNVQHYLEGKTLGTPIPTFFQTPAQLRMASLVDTGPGGPLMCAMDVNGNGIPDLLILPNLATGQVLTSIDGSNWRQGW
ncbi:MAG: hypothetical protein ACRECY_19105, partial [Phyllobacterium sp.]